ncbi:MAG: GIY-YIG nuclease family protein [Chloroflexi bacterium]|nr:GIY-YIG nuclease family protein [Chloroflexota bacterium]
MYTVYVHRSMSTGKSYIGQTEDLQRRFLEHQAGAARYSGGRGPWEIALTEGFSTRVEAMQREKFLKSGQGRALIKTILTARAGPSIGRINRQVAGSPPKSL